MGAANSARPLEVQSVAVGERVVGLDQLVAKSSAVDATGRLRQPPIDGLVCRPARAVAHEDGTVTEVARTAWDEIADPIVHVHFTTTPQVESGPGACISIRPTDCSWCGAWSR